jgi:sugar O-acyltransferase (sialic acid O-acetyltransferase NeuD family)
MSPQLLHIAGTGSFAAEIISWATASGAQPAGLIELRDPARVGTEIHGLPVVALEEAGARGVAAIGSGGDRREIQRRLAQAGWGSARIVHPAAEVAATARLGDGVTVGPMAVVGAEAEIGDHALLSRGTLVGHHAAVGAFVTLNPGCNVGGNSIIGEDAFIGMGATVVNGIKVGARATVAAGAVALREVGEATRVQGVPARPYPQ